MALQTTDEFLVNRGNASFRMPASQLETFIVDTGLTLQQVTDAGNTTTNAATFGGSVQSGGNPGSGVAAGSKITAAGTVVAARNGSANIFQGWNTVDASSATIELKANGYASFAKGIIELKSTGQTNISDDIQLNINNLGYSRLYRTSATDDSNEILSVSSGKNDNSANRGYLFNAGGFYINTGNNAGGNSKVEIIHDDGSAKFGSGSIQLNADGSVDATSGEFGDLTLSGTTMTSTGTVNITAGGTSGIYLRTKTPNSQYRFYMSDESAYAALSPMDLTANRVFKFPDEGGTLALATDVPSNFVTTDTNQTISGSKTFTSTVTLDGANVNQAIQTISNNTAWSMSDSNLWTTSATTLANPTSVLPGQTGVIFCVNPITGWGNRYKFPDGTPIDMEANSIIPYYVTESNVVRVGYPTNGVN